MKSKSVNSIIIISLITFSLILSTVEVFGGNGGSGYSRYGIGDISYFVSNRAIGMGGAGLAALSNNSIDRINPAGLSQINRTSYSISALYEGISTTDGIKSGYFGETSFDGIMIAIPIAPKNGIILSAGITPYSRINYNVSTSDSFDILNYSTQYRGDGGLAQGNLGISAIPINDIHVGAKFNYYMGTLNYTTKQSFGNSESEYYSEVKRSLELKGIGFTIGSIYSGLKNVFHLSDANTLNIGIVFTTTPYLTAIEEKFYTYRTVTVTTRDTTTSDDFKIRIPYSLGFGASYLSDRFLFAADIYYQNWNRYTFNEVGASELRDSYRFSMGGELLPKRDQSVPFLQRMPYRLGFFYNSSYYRINDKPINEFGITGGFGIPIFGDVRIDLGIEYSFRGTTDLQMQKDNIFRLSFSLSGSELWFVRPEQE